MKRIFALFVFSVICIGALQSVFGQEETNTDKDFRELLAKEAKMRKGRSYRVKRTSEVFDDKTMTLKRRIDLIDEFTLSARRSISSVSAPGVEIKKREVIVIGEKRFVKADGEWKIDDSILNTGLPFTTIAEKFAEKAIYNGQAARIYEVQQQSFYGDSKRKMRYWFDGEGNLLKVEDEVTNSTIREISRRISIYEYDPNIKIEAPIK